jgi:small GTP-binding protein
MESSAKRGEPDPIRKHRRPSTNPSAAGTNPRPSKVVQAADSAVIRLAFFENDTRLITTLDTGGIRIWDTYTWECLADLEGHSDYCRVVRVAEDTQRAISCANDGNIILWELPSWQPIAEYRGPEADTFFDVQFLPDSNAAMGGVRGINPLRIIDLASGERVAHLPINAPEIYSLAMIPNSTRVVVGGEKGFLEVWDYRSITRELKMQHEGAIHAMALTSDASRLVVSGDRSVAVWDLASGRQIAIFEGLTGPGIFGMAISSDDDYVIAATSPIRPGDGDIVMWELNTGRLCWRHSFHNDIVAGIAIPTSCEYFITGHASGQLRFWDFPTAESTRSVASSVHYVNAKVVLVGESGVGKSCLARALMKEPFQPQESTHGMKVWNFHSETVEGHGGDRITREIMLWDLAGQVDYRLVHQLFLDETVLGVVMFDATDPVDPFRGVTHWDKALSRVAGVGTPRLLVAGRSDRGYPAVSRDHLDEFRSRHGYASFLTSSAKTGQGVDEVRQEIRNAIEWDALPIVSSPDLWSKIRGYLLARRRGNPVLTTRTALRANFLRQNRGQIVSQLDFDTVIAHAQTQGFVWRLSFGDHVLMKPELLNSYAGAVVRAARNHPLGLGCVAERDILDGHVEFEDLQRITRSLERKLLYAVVELFLEREVAFRGGPTDELIVFPSKLNRERPELPGAPVPDVGYRFAGLVEDVYATLLVRLSHSDAFSVSDLYRDAAEYKDARGHTCGIRLEQPSEGQAVVFVFFGIDTSLDSKVLFLRFVHEHLRRRALPDSVVRERIYRCADVDCGEVVGDRRAIDSRLRRNLTMIPCQYCGGPVDLVDALETEFGDPSLSLKVRQMDEQVIERRAEQVGVTVSKAKDEVGEFDVFLAHHRADKLEVEAICNALRLRGLNPWLDEEQVPPGRWFQDVLQVAIRDVRSAAIIVGTTGLGPWQMVELRSFTSQCVDRRIPIIPVLLPNVHQIPMDFLFLRELNWVEFQGGIDDKAALDRLVWGITGQHPRHGRHGRL